MAKRPLWLGICEQSGCNFTAPMCCCDGTFLYANFLSLMFLFAVKALYPTILICRITGKLLPRDGVIGSEGSVAIAANDAVLTCPCDGIGAPRTVRHIGKDAASGHSGPALHDKQTDLSTVKNEQIIAFQKVSLVSLT